MKRKRLSLILCVTILALGLSAFTGSGHLGLAVKFEVVSRVNTLLTRMTIEGILFVSDLVFILSALAFNLLLAVFFVAQKNRWVKTARVIGILWLLLAIPLTFVFARYLAEGRGLAIVVPLVLVLLYMLVEFLLDFVFKVEFRRSWKTHVPYIVLEYVALFSLIGIAFRIDRNWGYLVSITFWILLAGLIYYLFADKLSIRKHQASKG